MITAGVLALLFDIEILAELVSIGTLVVFAMVCSGVLFRRVHTNPYLRSPLRFTYDAIRSSWKQWIDLTRQYISYMHLFAGATGSEGAASPCGRCSVECSPCARCLWP